MTRLHELYERRRSEPLARQLEALLPDLGPPRRARRLRASAASRRTRRSWRRRSPAARTTTRSSRRALSSGATVEEAYWDLVITDVAGRSRGAAAGVRRERRRRRLRLDRGLAALAHDTAGTIASARELHERIDEPNLLVKIPPPRKVCRRSQPMIAEGRSINVTLIFSLERYREVVEAYLSGLEKLVAGGGDPSRVASVASFFVSRVDTETDRRLEQIAKDDPGSASRGTGALELRGKAAVAQARLAYRAYLELFSGARWEALEPPAPGAQRPLWASTSTKNPAYPDLAYVDTLVAHEHRQHDAGRDPRALLRPRHGRADRPTPTSTSAEATLRAPRRVPASTSPTSPRCSRPRAWPPSPPPSTTFSASCRRRRTRSGRSS